MDESCSSTLKDSFSTLEDCSSVFKSQDKAIRRDDEDEQAQICEWQALWVARCSNVTGIYLDRTILELFRDQQELQMQGYFFNMCRAELSELSMS